jgi:hypothetical protein
VERVSQWRVFLGGFSYVKEVGREVTPLRSARKFIEKIGRIW